MSEENKERPSNEQNLNREYVDDIDTDFDVSRMAEQIFHEGTGAEDTEDEERLSTHVWTDSNTELFINLVKCNYARLSHESNSNEKRKTWQEIKDALANEVALLPKRQILKKWSELQKKYIKYETSRKANKPLPAEKPPFYELLNSFIPEESLPKPPKPYIISSLNISNSAESLPTSAQVISISKLENGQKNILISSSVGEPQAKKIKMVSGDILSRGPEVISNASAALTAGYTIDNVLAKHKPEQRQNRRRRRRGGSYNTHESVIENLLQQDFEERKRHNEEVEKHLRKIHVLIQAHTYQQKALTDSLVNHLAFLKEKFEYLTSKRSDQD